MNQPTYDAERLADAIARKHSDWASMTLAEQLEATNAELRRIIAIREGTHTTARNGWETEGAGQ